MSFASVQDTTATALDDREISKTESQETEPVITPADSAGAWSLFQRALFRFVFAYFVVYLLTFLLGLFSEFVNVFVDRLPFLSGLVSGLQAINNAYDEIWQAVVPRVGNLLFKVTITVRPNDSGDTTYNYVQVLCFFMIAAVVACVWTIVDRKRASSRWLFHVLRIYVRYGLATIMITYGAAKIIKLQFPNPSLDRLIQPFGDASPMGLLWTFMGASESYNIFTGVGEVLGGLLLTTRRTTLLGALISLGVMSHVAMLNFSYDVPVKLLSLHLLAMCAFLIAPDLGRIVRMFITNRPVEPIEIRPLLKRPRLDHAAVAVRAFLVLLYLGMTLWGANESRKKYGDLALKSPLRGIWKVDEFEVDGKVRPPLITDQERWRRVVFDYPQMIAIQLMTDTRRRYMLKIDPAAKTIDLSKRDDPAWKTTLFYQQPEPGLIALEGTLDGKKIRAKLLLTDTADFLLINRGFHWINEYPFNR
jgi:hypothetical protein